jgi:glycosyltransferase involved in cell wall biosynthesis
MPMVTEISVVIPTWNRSQLLRLALRSVLWQRDVELEVIVVDDGSTDDTSEVVGALGEPRIRLIRQNDPGGVSSARNQGADEATGEWLAFLDDDDVWAPDKLTRQLSAAQADGRAWVYTGWVTIDERLQVMAGRAPPSPEEVAKLLYQRNAIPTGGSNVMVHREAFELAGGFDTELTNGEDWELWIRLAAQGPPACVSDPLMAYRIHPGMASLDTGAMWSGVDLIERRHRTTVDRGSIERWIAESCLRNGQRTEALKYLARAAIHGDARGVAGDLLGALGRRLDRRLGRPLKTFQRMSDPEWAARAQHWLDELAIPPTSPVL